MNNQKTNQNENTEKNINTIAQPFNQQAELEAQLRLINYKMASAQYYHQVNQLCAVTAELNQADKHINMLETTKQYAQATADLEECLHLKQEAENIFTQLQNNNQQDQAQQLTEQYQQKNQQLQQKLNNQNLKQQKPDYQKYLTENKYSKTKHQKAQADINQCEGYLTDYLKKASTLQKEKAQHLAQLAQIKQTIQELGYQRAIEQDQLVNLPYEQQTDYYNQQHTNITK